MGIILRDVFNLNVMRVSCCGGVRCILNLILGKYEKDVKRYLFHRVLQLN